MLIIFIYFLVQNAKLSTQTTTNHPEFIAPPFSPKFNQKKIENSKIIEKIEKKNLTELKVEAAKTFGINENEVVEPM